MVIIMESSYNHAISAGIVGGIVLAVLAFINLALQIVMGSFSGVIVDSCCYWLLSLLVMLGVGALAVMFARHRLHSILDAVVVSLLAGGVAGAIDGVVRVFVDMLRPTFSGSLWGFVGREATTLICAPVTIVAYIVIVAILAAVGGALYGALVARIP
jgi:hypothetical protein